MSHIEQSVFIKASPEKIWDIAIDPRHWIDWHEEIARVDDIEGNGTTGTSCDMTYKMAGVPLHFTCTVLESERGRKWTGHTKGALDSTITYLYEQEGDGTQIKEILDYTVPGAVLGKVADKLFIERNNREAAEHSLNKLKAFCESGQS